MNENRITTPANHIGPIMESLEKLIEQAPEEAEGRPSIQAGPRYVTESAGWGRKYREPIELRGEEWHREFAKAGAAVEACGIIAMMGGRGPGKTQMAAEIARAGRWPEDRTTYTRGDGRPIAHRSKTAIYTRAMDIFLDLREAAKNHVKSSEKAVLERLSGCGLLVIDEFQERGESEWENRVMKNLIDKRYSDDRPTILIANMTRGDMGAALGDSIKDRVRECGCVIEFNWPSYRANRP